MLNLNIVRIAKRVVGGWFVMFADDTAVIAKKRGRWWSELEIVRWARRA